jgi:hypothetical protein
MIRKVLLLFIGFALTSGLYSAVAQADYFNYPCSPPGTGTGVDINAIVAVSGQFCDGPTQINLTHLHCESGGASVNIGGLALTGTNGLSIGGIAGRGTGGSGAGCSWRCPDNILGPEPNPPFYGGQAPFVDVRRIIKAHRAFCVTEHHLVAAGLTSVLVRPEEGDPDNYKPGPSVEDLVAANQAEVMPPKVEEPQPNSEPQAVQQGSEPDPNQPPNPATPNPS